MISRFCRRSTDDDGFTLVELTVAMVVTMLVLTSLIIVFLGSIRGVALSKQRQAATGLATSTMEQFRALDYGTLSAGLYCSDLAGDGNVTVSGTCGGGGTATLTPAGTSINETLKVQTGTPPATAVAPVYPHVTTKTIENVTYTTKAYVTVSPTTPAAFNLTVLVSWASNVTRGTKTVTERSVEFSPSRCLSSATHPYSGACQAAFNADAGFGNAVVTVTEATGAAHIPGFDTGKQLQLALGSLSTTLGVEQITKLTGKVQTTSASATTDGGTSTTGGVSGAVAADSDPSSATLGTPQTANPTQGSVNTLTLSGVAGVLKATPATGGSGQLDARVSSGASSCYDAANSPLSWAALRPCTWGSRQATGTAGNVSLQLPNGAPNFAVVSIGTEPVPARATTAIVATPGGTACPTAAGAGCVTAQASRSLGAITLGGLPSASGSDIVPTNWGGSLINLSGVVENAYADSGSGARPTPAFTRSAGTLKYYDAPTSSVKTLDLTTLASDTSVTVAPVTATYNLGNGHQTIITESAQFTAGASSFSKSSNPDATCKTQPCSASASPSSTLVAQIFYTITLDGVQATSFAVAVDLGACVARTSYTAAFDA